MLASVTGNGSWHSANHASSLFKIVEHATDGVKPVLVLKLSDSNELFTFESVVLISEQNDQNNLRVFVKKTLADVSDFTMD